MHEISKRTNPAAQPAARLLVVSREPAGLGSLWNVGELNGWGMEMTGSGCEALERVQANHSPDLVVLDLGRGDSDGMFTLRWLRRVRPDLPVVLLSQVDGAQQEVEAIRLGAQDFLVRPVEERHLEAALRRQLHALPGSLEAAIGDEQTKAEPLGDDMFFVAASTVMRKLRAQAELLAQVDEPLLIVGESGSGKETTARLIHQLSVRSGFRFRKVNCAALPGDLLERELFGFETGAFPGALRTRAGKFELSDKGTVLLDDLAEAPPQLQARVLQVLQEGRFTRVGGDTPVEVDVRIIAATNGNLESALTGKKLREDLYYRLSAFTVHVPPLRHRRDEIVLLLRHCMNQLARRYGLPPRPFPPAMLEACLSHAWPGNLPELENFVKRYLITGDHDLALAELEEVEESEPLAAFSLPLETALRPPQEIHETEEHTSGLRSLVQSVKGEAERNAIAAALEQTGWNRKAAARLLKVSYRTLLYKVQQYHLSPPPHYALPSLLSHAGKGSGRQEE